MSGIPVFLHDRILHNFGYLEIAEVSFISNVSANTKHFFFSFIYQNYKMYMWEYYTACMGNHKYYSTDMLNITNTIHKP